MNRYSAIRRNRAVLLLFCILMITILLTVSVYAQLSGNIIREEITRPGSNFYWGEATSSDRDEARDRALAELSRNISVSVSSDFEHRWKESGTEYEDFMEAVVNTYTAATFTNLQPLTERDRWGNHTFLYFISKEDLQKEFDKRKEQILYLYETALNEENAANLSRALQYYYYAIIVMNSVPERNINYRGKNLAVEIPNHIRNIMRDVRFTFEGDIRPSESLRTVMLRIDYKGRPVQELDFVFIERMTEHKVKARDGRAACDLIGASVSYDNLDIEIEYRFAAERDCVPLVAELWRGVNRPSFNNRRRIDFDTPVLPPPSQKMEILPDTVADRFQLLVTNKTDCPVQPQISKETLKLLETIANGDTGQIKTAYANDPFLSNKLTTIINHNHPRIVDNIFQVELNQTWQGWEIRSLPVMCSYPSIKTQTMEYLVLDFDENGNLTDVSFNVFDELFNSFVNDVDCTDEERLQRQTIVKFLEKYRTAFLNRDIETLEKIFADEAVIIVGRILRPAETKRRYELDNEMEEIEYLKMTKTQYLQRQKRIFAAQRDIHIGFNTFNLLKKDRQTDVYGISMRQQYSSSGYADEGHLFLLIDFMEKDPLIYVRSWQPSEWTKEQILNMSDFTVLE